MKKLIKSLFESQMMELHSSSSLELYSTTEDNKTNYWLVTCGEPKLNAELQSYWLQTCKEIIPDPALEKNINLLILWQVESFNEHTNNLVHLAEEDSFFFKKHVLPYTLNEKIELERQINSSGVESLFAQTLIDADTFSSYKSLYLKGSWQSLLYRIAIKISTLKIPNATAANLDSLEKSILEKVQLSSNSNSLISLENVLFSVALDSQFQEYSPSELFSKINEEFEDKQSD